MLFDFHERFAEFSKESYPITYIRPQNFFPNSTYNNLLKKRSLKEMCAHYDNVRTQVMKIVMCYFFPSFLKVLSI